MNDGMDTYLSEIHGQSWEFHQISTLVLCILYRVVKYYLPTVAEYKTFVLVFCNSE